MTNSCDTFRFVSKVKHYLMSCIYNIQIKDERVKSIMLEIREDMLVDGSLQPIANLSNIVNTIAKIINNL